MLLRFPVIATALFSIVPCSAATLVDVTGSAFGSGTTITGVGLASSWTFSVDYTDVSISAAFNEGDGYAYLMRAVGPGITVAQEVSSGSFSSSGEPTLIFSGLDLSAGTYHLVVQGADSVCSMVGRHHDHHRARSYFQWQH